MFSDTSFYKNNWLLENSSVIRSKLSHICLSDFSTKKGLAFLGESLYLCNVCFRNEQLANDKICNCSSSTFGKFCEYEFMTMNTFELTIEYQFYLKGKYRNGSQLWGNITCYTTLTNCYFGLRCLTWQNICDGKYIIHCLVLTIK